MSLTPVQIQHLKSYASVLISTFVGGAVAGVTAALTPGVPESFTWKIVVIVGITGGLTAIKHLFDTVPGDRPEAVIGEILSTVDVPDPVKAVVKAAGPLVCLLLLARLTTGCIAPAQSAKDIKTVDDIFTVADEACIAGLVIAPVIDPNLPPATIDLARTVCKLGPVADSWIDQAIRLFTTQPAIAQKVIAAKRAANAAGKW